MNILFFTATLSALWPAAPLISTINGLSPVPIQAPLFLLWGVIVARHRISSKAVAAAWVVIILGILATAIGQPDFRSWWTLLGTLLLPVGIFLIIQSVGVENIPALEAWMARALYVVAAAQVYYFWTAGGGAGAFAPKEALALHSSIDFWRAAGSKVLGNPNNASIIYCTGLAFAVRAFLNRSGGRVVMVVVAATVTALAVWVTGSRGAYLTAVATVLIGLAAGRVRRVRLVPVAIAGMAVYWLATLWLRALNQGSATEASWGTRLGTRLAAIRAISDHPLGFGVGRTPEGLSPYLGAVDFRGASTVGATSHDMFLNWTLSMGVLSLLAVIPIFWVAFRRSIRDQGWIGALPLAAFFVSGQSTGIDLTNSSNPAWAVTLWMLIGLAWRRSEQGIQH